MFPGQLSRTIGTRTNVIKLPNKETRRVYTNPMDIEKATDDQIEVLRKRVEDIIPDIPKLNDQQKLTLENNLQRLANREGKSLEPKPEADIIDLGTRTKVQPEGIETLKEDLGLPSDVDPNSPLGSLMTRTKRIEKMGKDLAKDLDDKPKTTEELYEETRRAIEEPSATEKAERAKLKQGLESMFDDVMRSQRSMRQIEDEGLVRATARQILFRDIKDGKIPSIERVDDIKEPIDTFRELYGEDALEVLSDAAPEFRQLYTAVEAEDLVRKRFKFEPKLNRPKESYTKEELEKLPIDPDDPTEFAKGGLAKILEV